MLAPEAQGRGLAAKAIAQVVDDTFEQRGARRVFADADQDNSSCIGLFERLGFQREGLLRGLCFAIVDEAGSVLTTALLGGLVDTC